MEGKRTTRGLNSRGSRWAAVLVIVLSVLSAQQSWAVIACHCGNFVAALTQPGRDSERLSETHCAACRRQTRENETAGNSRDSRDKDQNIASDVPALVTGTPKDQTLQSVTINASCCCPSQPPVPVGSVVSFSIQQPIPIEEAPAVVVSGLLATAVSINIHGPPTSTRSRPLYIVQSSLLI